jgi:hypothetical protein
LSFLDSKNFNDEKIATYQKMLVDYVYAMHEKVIYRKTKEEKFQEEQEEMLRKKKETEEREELQKEVSMLENEVDEFTRLLYEDVITSNLQENGEASNSQNKDETYYRNKRQLLHETIQAQVTTYIKYCKDMNMLLVLEQYGNEKYKEDSAKDEVNKSKIVKYTDAVYVSKYFDLLLWWKEVGSRTFVEVSCAALVMLGKPTHNAFQERVFSRGTYKDSLLKKSLKENKFEMAVLNSLNGEQVQEYVEKGYCRRIVEDNLDHRVNEFFNRSNGTEDIIDDDGINNNNTETDVISVNLDDEYAYLLDSDSDSDSSNGDSEGEDLQKEEEEATVTVGKIFSV